MFIIYILDLFKSVSFKSVWPLILAHHPIFKSESYNNSEGEIKIRKNGYRVLNDTFLHICNMDESVSVDDSIYMIVVRDTNPYDINKTKIESYLVNVDELNEKVTLWSGEHDIKRYGYNFIDWNKILGYSLCPMSLEKLSTEEIVCEIFCEMTRFGITEEKIKEMGAFLSDKLGDMNISYEVNTARKRNYSEINSWFSSLCDKIHLASRPRELNKQGTQEKVVIINNEKIHIDYINSIGEN